MHFWEFHILAEAFLNSHLKNIVLAKKKHFFQPEMTQVQVLVVGVTNSVLPCCCA